MTRQIFLLALLALAVGSLGCCVFDTPRRLRGSERPDRYDLPIEEQERRARARYGLHEDNYRVGPHTYTDRVSPTGVGR